MMNNNKVKISIYLPARAKEFLDELYITGIKSGNKKSYGDILAGALFLAIVKEADEMPSLSDERVGEVLKSMESGK